MKDTVRDLSAFLTFPKDFHINKIFVESGISFTQEQNIFLFTK